MAVRRRGRLAAMLGSSLFASYRMTDEIVYQERHPDGTSGLYRARLAPQ